MPPEAFRSHSLRFDAWPVFPPVRMMEYYRNYQELTRHARIGIDFSVESREGASGVAVIAIHGGGIEPGTTELAEAVAGRRHAYYSFRGRMPSDNRFLHLTSRSFDEPRALGLVGTSFTVVSIHGCSDADSVAYIGGRNQALRSRVRAWLRQAGFAVRESPFFPGAHPMNICNRCRSGMGVQLELSAGLRRQMFAGSLQSRQKNTTAVFDRFVGALRKALREYLEAEGRPASE